MDKQKAVMHSQTFKGCATNLSNEIERNWTKKQWQNQIDHKIGNNYDMSRAHLNFEVGRGGIIKPIDNSVSIAQRIKDNFSARGIKDPNQGLDEPLYRTVVGTIFSGTRETMHRLAFDRPVNLDKGADNSEVKRKQEIEEWAKDMYKFACKEWGEDNIVGFYVHLDEMSPHIHCVTVPVTPDNKVSYKKVWHAQSRESLSKYNHYLWDECAKVTAKYGLERGGHDPSLGKQEARPLSKYLSDMRQECEDVKQDIANAKVEKKRLETAVKGLTTMLNNLTSEIEKKKAELAELEKMDSNQKDKIESLKKEISDLEAKRDDKAQKLANVERKLDSLNNQTDKVQENLERVQSEYSTTKELNEKLQKQNAVQINTEKAREAINAIKTGLLESLKSEHDDFIREHPDIADWDGLDVFNSIAENVNKTIEVGVFLFFGLTSEAIDAAQASGGGGGGAPSKDKDDDEDDREWARICAQSACRMMRPKGGRKKGRRR